MERARAASTPANLYYTIACASFVERGGIFFKNHFSVALLQLAEYPAQAGGLAVVQPVAVVAGVAVGACGVAAELADGQLLPAAAADEASRLPQGHVTVSHVQ